jgi:ABC-type glutathione transport system ATPase component
LELADGEGQVKSNVEPTSPLLEVRNLAVHYDLRSSRVGRKERRKIEAVADVSFTLLPGETVALVGESGSGKTTTGRAILGLVPITSGAVLLRGEDITGADRKKLKQLRREMQLVYQNPFSSLNPYMDALELVMEPIQVNRLAPSRTSAEARAGELLELVALPRGLWQRKPRSLSGGQLQRVAIARALAVEPQILIADEPVSKLDVSIQAQVVNLLQDIQKELGISYLFITHNLAIARHMADRMGIMQHGRLVEFGEADEIFESPSDPYTKELLAAIPGLAKPPTELGRGEAV